MSALSNRMNAIKTLFTDNLPAGRIVTRNFTEAHQRSNDELAQGVYTIMSRGASGFNSPVDVSLLDGTHKIFISGQFVMPEKTPGEQIEDAELAMFDEVVAVLAVDNEAACSMDIKSFNQSAQLEAPYGWVLIEIEWRDID